MIRPTRRQFLYALNAACAGFPYANPFVRLWNSPRHPPEDLLSSRTDTQTLFEEVPEGKGGISWHHVNGRSPGYYLPETTGAGCAFLDYDNDGWMDIYLVNSGKCDFYDPK